MVWRKLPKGKMDGEISLEFMTGNPQLGVLSGRLTYLQSCSGEGDERKRASSLENSSSHGSNIKSNTSASSENKVELPNQHLPDRRSKLLCILSVPAHMVPTDMLHFAAPFKDQVHSIRILRPCNPVGPSDPARTPAEYMVLLQMESQVCLRSKDATARVLRPFSYPTLATIT